MSELLRRGAATAGLREIATRGARGSPWTLSVKFAESVTFLYSEKAESHCGIGTTEFATRSNPPLSRTLVCVIDEPTIAWMQDIVAIVNITRAMLASVTPVRNFLFIGYAIAVRTTGLQVRPRTTRVARARTVSLLNRTISRPPRIRSSPRTMNRVMSALAVPKNFQGLRTQARMTTPAP